MDKKTQIDLIVNFILNSYGEVEDILGTLDHYLQDKKLSQYVLDSIQTLCRTDFARYRRIFAPEPGDVTIRAWVAEILRDYEQRS